MTGRTRSDGKRNGFTMIELLVVLTLIALLASIAVPVVTHSILRAKEATLKENLFVTRKALDDYYADKGMYPPNLTALVEERYLRRLPRDPITENTDTWLLTHAEGSDNGQQGGIMDIHSGSTEISSDGQPYQQW